MLGLKMSHRFGISFALQLETERLDQVSTVSLLKDKISSLEDELNMKTHQLLNTSEDTAQYKTELSSLK